MHWKTDVLVMMWIERRAMKEITFIYKDELSMGKWERQHCTVESLAECKRIYGLDEPNVEYVIESVIDVE